MSDAERANSPLAMVADTAGAQVIEALSLIAEENRLAILLALWEAYEPREVNGVSFSRLFERTGYRDRGNFSYHLDKLVGTFVKQHGKRGGYELRKPGLKLIRAMVAGTGVTEATLDPMSIDEPCPLCGAPTEISYRDGAVFRSCTECPGAAQDEIDLDGALGLTEFDPAGLTDRTPAEIHAASRRAAWLRGRSMFDGLCPSCSARVDCWVDRCRDHDSADSVCAECGMPVEVLVNFECRVCKRFGISSPKQLAMYHPAVVAFYENHGESTRFRADDIAAARRVRELAENHGEEVTAENPLRIEVTVGIDDDEIRLTFDETARVIAVTN